MARSILPYINEKIKDRFWRKVNVLEIDDCWNWTASILPAGYGQISLGGNEVRLAHRVSWVIEHEVEVPNGFHVCHTCDNPSCVNPNHLWLGTDFDNAVDKMNKGRNNPVKGEDHQDAKLTEKDVIEIRRLLREGIKGNEVAEKFDVTESHVSRIKNGQKWKHIK